MIKRKESASENGSDDYPRIPISMDEPKEWTYTMRRHMQNSVRPTRQELGAIPTTSGSLLFSEGESESESIENRSSDCEDMVEEYPSRNSPANISEFHLSRLVLKEVVPGLYLGPYSAAIRSKLQCLLEHGITHIVCVRHHTEANFIKPNFPDKFQYLVLDIADTATENIIHHFQQVKAFIDEGLNSGGQVLVHSNAGISRSAALVLAYVMETYGLSQTRAYAMVQQKRFCINPNEGFMTQLREYEPIYQAQKILRNGQQSSVRQRSKRTIHQMDTERVEDRCDEMDS